MKLNLKKIFYLILQHKFKKPSCITQAHFDVLRLLISAKRRLSLPSRHSLRTIKNEDVLKGHADAEDVHWEHADAADVHRGHTDVLRTFIGNTLMLLTLTENTLMLRTFIGNKLIPRTFIEDTFIMRTFINNESFWELLRVYNSRNNIEMKILLCCIKKEL